MTISSTVVVACEAWVPLVLASSTEAVSISSSVIFSIFWLKEVFYPKYDIPALTLIILGCLSIIIQADKTTEEIDFD